MKNNISEEAKVKLLTEKLQKITGKKVVLKENRSLGDILNSLPIRIAIDFNLERDQDLPMQLRKNLEPLVDLFEHFEGNEYLFDTTFRNLPKINDAIKASGVSINKVEIYQKDL